MCVSVCVVLLSGWMRLDSRSAQLKIYLSIRGLCNQLAINFAALDSLQNAFPASVMKIGIGVISPEHQQRQLSHLSIFFELAIISSWMNFNGCFNDRLENKCIACDSQMSYSVLWNTSLVLKLYISFHIGSFVTLRTLVRRVTNKHQRS